MRKIKEKTIEELAKKASKGDLRAFEEICRQSSEKILYNTYIMLKDHHDAEDVTQEIYIKMLNGIQSLKNPVLFNAWMQRIITNECLTFIKKKKKAEMDINIERLENVIEEDDVEVLPWDFLEKETDSKKFMEIIDTLPRQRKRVLCLRYLENMSYKEIAHAMDMSTSTVASTMTRGKRQIKEMLDKNSDFNRKYIGSSTTGILSMSQLFKEDVSKKIDSNQAENIAEGFIKSIDEKLLRSAEFKVKNRFKKILIGGLTVLGCVVLIVSGGIKNEVTPEHTGTISFSGSTSPHQHINPKMSEISDVSLENPSYSWKIVDNTTNKNIFLGETPKIKNEYIWLYDNKKNGDYTLVYICRDKKGEEVEVKRAFTINTDEANKTGK